MTERAEQRTKRTGRCGDGAIVGFDASVLLERPPYGLDRRAKAALFEGAVNALTRHHVAHCPEYRKMLGLLGYTPDLTHPLETLPPLPVRLFKEFDLVSTDRREIVKTLTSSGTTGQQVSRIHLDRRNATLQTKVLARLLADFTGRGRLPMLIVDARATVGDRRRFSARGAGILGFAMLGSDVTYALDAHMRLDRAAVDAFCERHAHERVLLFGFTSIVWRHLYQPLHDSGSRLPLHDGVLLHGGGWKKLADQAVDRETFNEGLGATCGVTEVVNYYGMVEQTGSIFLECPEGHLHSSCYSDVLVRRPDFGLAAAGEPGTLQLLSVLPTSYPGHNLLSEDQGELLGEDDCACGRKGRYFRVHGRIRQAEIRGCSDTYTPA